jgi:hypothetical protein
VGRVSKYSFKAVNRIRKTKALLLLSLLQTITNFYPELLENVFVVNAPWGSGAIVKVRAISERCRLSGTVDELAAWEAVSEKAL